MADLNTTKDEIMYLAITKRNFIVTITALTGIFLSEVDGCANYTVVSETERAQGYAFSWPWKCDRRLLIGWYRFQGTARDRIADKCVLEGRCGTDFSGWLSGTHPTLTEGAVIRKVCFSGERFCCVTSHEIRVKNCSSYYVYELKRGVFCKILRYCGNESAGKLTSRLPCDDVRNNE